MKYILDTHCWLWMLLSPDKLSEQTIKIIENNENELFLSLVSTWEMSIKHGLGKLKFPEPIETYIPSRLKKSQTQILNINLDHTLFVNKLPKHHRDPFDRMLIAQSKIEKIPIITADEKIMQYDLEYIQAN